MIQTLIARQLVRRPLGARLTAGCLGRLAHRRTIAGRYDDATELADVGLDILGPHESDRRVLLVGAQLHGHTAAAAALGRGSTATGFGGPQRSAFARRR